MPHPHRDTGLDPSTNDTLAERDRELAARIRAGDTKAFEVMFRAHYDALCRSIVHLVGSRDVAEDVVQGVCVRIWHQRARWEPRGPLRNYLHAAVRRRAMSELRHEAVRARTAPVLAIEAAARADGPVDAAFEAEELRARFERALASLPPRTREAFELSRGEGLSYHEVALRMGISPKTVGVHISRSLTVLRRAMLGLVVAVLGTIA